MAFKRKKCFRGIVESKNVRISKPLIQLIVSKQREMQDKAGNKYKVPFVLASFEITRSYNGK
jgi:hypothetical protein